MIQNVWERTEIESCPAGYRSLEAIIFPTALSKFLNLKIMQNSLFMIWYLKLFAKL